MGVAPIEPGIISNLRQGNQDRLERGVRTEYIGGALRMGIGDVIS